MLGSRSEIVGDRSAPEPRLLLVTPEVSFLPEQMGSASRMVSIRTGTLADLSAGLIGALHELGADIHVAIPNYRNIFRSRSAQGAGQDLIPRIGPLAEERIHLAQDRAFFYPTKLSPHQGWEAVKIALAFQREVINRIIPEVKPDLVHCCDWMTGLIPAMTRELGIPCLYTLSSLNTAKVTLSTIEERGIDAASFWQHCYYSRMPAGYEETRNSNPVDMLLSAVFSAHFVNAASPSFLAEVIEGRTPVADPAVGVELSNKAGAGCLAGISHAPDPSFDPSKDGALYRRYRSEDHFVAKAFNKLHLQEILGLAIDSKAPVFFWPTRLDSDRPGGSLMAGRLSSILEKYESQGLQVVFIADGDGQALMRQIAAGCGAQHRVAVSGFDTRLYRLGYGAADFVLAPVLVEPCGLPCRIGQRYGALPVGYDAGGTHDAVTHLAPSAGRGNGFLFRFFDAEGLTWAVDQAMAYFGLGPAARDRQVQRIMTQTMVRDDPYNTAFQYIDLYSRMLRRPLDHLKSLRRAAEEPGVQTAAA
jgi:glycogen synthase